MRVPRSGHGGDTALSARTPAHAHARFVSTFASEHGKRQLLAGLIPPILGGNGPATDSPTTDPDPAPTTPSDPSESTTPTSGTGGSRSNSGSDPPSASATSPASANSSTRKSNVGNKTNGNSPSPAAASTAAGAPSTAAQASTAPAVAPSSGAADASASVSTVVTVVTGTDGSLQTSTMSLSLVPTSDPFATASTSVNGTSLPLLVGSATTGSAAEETSGGLAGVETSDTGSGGGRSKAITVGVPIAVVAGVLLIGLLVAFGLAKHRRWMERQLYATDKDSLISRDAGATTPGSAAAANGSGRGRRGSMYEKGTDAGHVTFTAVEAGAGAGAGAAAAGGGGLYEHKRDLNGSNSSLRRAIRSGEFEIEDDASSYADHTTEMTGAHADVQQPAATYASHGQGASHRYVDDLIAVGASQSSRSIGQTDGFGGHTAATTDPDSGESEQPCPTSGHDGPPAAHWDGSAQHGYSNPATRGHDAAGMASATGQGPSSLSPYYDLTRNKGPGMQDMRASYAGTEVSNGNPDRAYGGADFLSNSMAWDYRATEDDSRPNPRFDGYQFEDQNGGGFAGFVGNRASKVRSFFNKRY